VCRGRGPPVGEYLGIRHDGQVITMPDRHAMNSPIGPVDRTSIGLGVEAPVLVVFSSG
jgi:hypothetical protein